MSAGKPLPRIPLAGVIGHPVVHSKSPVLFRHWLTAYDLPGHYIHLDIAPADLRDVIRTMPRMGFVGANVTIPHKQQVMDLADQVSDRAIRIGAANTLTFGADGAIHADNTDGYGFLENLRQSAPGWEPAQGMAIVLGAGGAARAVLASLLDAGVPHIMLSNRTSDRAHDLARDFGDRIEVVDWDTIPALLDRGRLVVNTTSLGMSGKSPLTMPLDRLHDGQLVTDLVYVPLRTRLLEEAAARGCATVDGLGMLLHQAVPGFQRWFGTRPAVTAATRKAILA